MSIVDDAIKSLNLGYEIEYCVVSLSNKDIIKYQEEFYNFLCNRLKNKKISPLESKEIEKRVYPQNTLQGAKSVVVILFPYFTTSHKKGNISYYCMGEDYHIAVTRNLKKISKYLSNICKDANFAIQTDNGNINEKFFAYNSGLAILGMNSLIISKIYGSYVNIGLIIADVELEEKLYTRQKCDECMRCFYCCPANAINKDFTIDSLRCSSFITQKKGELTDIEISTIKKTKKVFGCDICQEVCHLNNNVKKIPENYDIIRNIFLKDLDISNKQFRSKYIDRAFSFRGKSVLIRNISIINSEEEVE